MPTPQRSCRWCGADTFIQADSITWEIRSRATEGHGRKVSGSLVVCTQCGLVETFLDEAAELLNLPDSHEVQVPGLPARAREAGYRAPMPSGESPVGMGWQVVLVHAGPQPIGVISALRKDLPMSLPAARAQLRQLPWVLTRTSNRRMADALYDKLTALGATVRVEPSAV